MQFFKSLLSVISGLGAMLAFFGIIVVMMLVPQYSILWFVDEAGANGGPMLLPILALVILGNLYFKAREFQYSIIIVAVCVLAMANMRGFFWRPFEDGEGFWTLNRITGFLLFSVAFVSFEMYRRLAKRCNW